MWKALGKALRRERDACGLSVREIARRSGVSFRTLYAYELGESGGGIEMKKFIAICDAIGCDPCALLREARREEGKPEAD